MSLEPVPPHTANAGVHTQPHNSILQSAIGSRAGGEGRAGDRTIGPRGVRWPGVAAGVKTGCANPARSHPNTALLRFDAGAKLYCAFSTPPPPPPPSLSPPPTLPRTAASKSPASMVQPSKGCRWLQFDVCRCAVVEVGCVCPNCSNLAKHSCTLKPNLSLLRVRITRVLRTALFLTNSTTASVCFLSLPHL